MDMIDSQTTSHDSQQLVAHCLLPRPHCSRVSSHLVIQIWPLDCFATCFATCIATCVAICIDTCVATCSCFAFLDSFCMSLYKSEQPLSVRPLSVRSLAACPAEAHTGRSLSALLPSYSVNRLTFHNLSKQLFMLTMGLNRQVYCSTVIHGWITQSNGSMEQTEDHTARTLRKARTHDSNMARTTSND